MQPVKVVLSDDRMEAYVVLAPECEVTLRDIILALKEEGVTKGISAEALQEALMGERGIPYRVASGIAPPKEVLESLPKPKLLFNFAESVGKPPEILTVGPDFPSEWKRLLSRGLVTAGATLAFVRAAHSLPKAITVTGEEIPYLGSRSILKLGPNTQVSLDGQKVISVRPGIPYEDDEGIGVLDHITIVGDVGPLTGNISFPGDITIRGSILAGFSVSTYSNLIVNGNLWGSATAKAKIIVSGGITAPGETVDSGQGIACKFCENSIIRSSGYVEVESALIHSVVESESEVSVTGEGGRIVGGLVRAVTAITAGIVGSPMGVPTVLELGVSPKLRRELARLERELETVTKELSEISSAAQSRARISTMDRVRLTRELKLLQEREKAIRERLYLLKKSLSDAPKGFFQADKVLPGTRLVMGMDVHEFTSPIDNISMGARRA
ncbi:MAG TPA: DUF342 domain-containing protein [Firmicutes bacterium]|nr:DUF342 domain-containing protein [Candidatus Fermentithermobacillaceae bacterium]